MVTEASPENATLIFFLIMFYVLVAWSLHRWSEQNDRQIRQGRGTDPLPSWSFGALTLIFAFVLISHLAFSGFTATSVVVLLLLLSYLGIQAWSWLSGKYAEDLEPEKKRMMNKILLGHVRMKKGNTIWDDFVLYTRNRHTLISSILPTTYNPIDVGEKINMLFVSSALAFFLGGFVANDMWSSLLGVTLPTLVVDTILWYLAVAEDQALVKREAEKRRGRYELSENEMAMHQKNIEFLVCTRNERSVVTKADTCVWIQNLMLRATMVIAFILWLTATCSPSWGKNDDWLSAWLVSWAIWFAYHPILFYCYYNFMNEVDVDEVLINIKYKIDKALIDPSMIEAKAKEFLHLKSSPEPNQINYRLDGSLIVPYDIEGGDNSINFFKKGLYEQFKRKVPQKNIEVGINKQDREVTFSLNTNDYSLVDKLRQIGLTVTEICPAIRNELYKFKKKDLEGKKDDDAIKALQENSSMEVKFNFDNLCHGDFMTILLKETSLKEENFEFEEEDLTGDKLEQWIKEEVPGYEIISLTVRLAYNPELTFEKQLEPPENNMLNPMKDDQILDIIAEWATRQNCYGAFKLKIKEKRAFLTYKLVFESWSEGRQIRKHTRDWKQGDVDEAKKKEQEMWSVVTSGNRWKESKKTRELLGSKSVKENRGKKVTELKLMDSIFGTRSLYSVLNYCDLPTAMIKKAQGHVIQSVEAPHKDQETLLEACIEPQFKETLTRFAEIHEEINRHPCAKIKYQRYEIEEIIVHQVQFDSDGDGNYERCFIYGNSNQIWWPKNEYPIKCCWQYDHFDCNLMTNDD